MRKLLTQEEIEDIKNDALARFDEPDLMLIDHIDALAFELKSTESRLHEVATACANAEAERDQWLSVIGEIIATIPINDVLEASKTVGDSIAYFKGLHERVEKAEAELKRRDALAWPMATEETAKGGWKLNWDFLEAIEKKARAADGDEGAPSLEQIEIALISALEVYPLYAAPPAPAVPDEIRYSNPACECSDDAERDIYTQGWNACRAAMLANKEQKNG